MTQQRVPRLGWVAVLAGLSAAGCIERRETITVDADGGAAVHVEFETRSFSELYEGDAIPTVEAGWLVEATIEKDAQDREVFRLEADALFLPGTGMPSSYASPRDAEPDLWLQFPTEVTVEERRTGTYYHFRRRYAARPWAHVQWARETFEKQLEELDIDEPSELPEEERAQLVRLLTTFQATKVRVFARAAFLEAMPDVPQDAWLFVRAALMRVAEARDPARFAVLFGDDADEHGERVLAAEEEAFEAAALEAMEHVLRGRPDVDQGDVNAFVRRYRWHHRFDALTDELGDDRFTIEVTMPGEIVAHNADEARNGTVTWKFSGEQLRDRELELMVTSRLR